MLTLDPAIKPTLSVDEFASAVGISRSTAYGAIHAGQVPGALRFGTRIRIPTAVVKRMLNGELAIPGGAPDEPQPA